jgi:hypothetical protein
MGGECIPACFMRKSRYRRDDKWEHNAENIWNPYVGVKSNFQCPRAGSWRGAIRFLTPRGSEVKVDAEQMYSMSLKDSSAYEQGCAGQRFAGE